MTSLADHVWWRNLRGGAPVTVRLRGERRSGTAEVVEDDRAVAEYVGGYLDRHGLESAGRLSIAVDGETRPAVEALVAELEELVVISVELDGEAP